MEQFTPYEYTLIAMANANGMDKKLWEERIDWADKFVTDYSFKEQLAYAREECTDESIILSKAINAHDDILKGKPTGFLCNLDATASGIQIMSAVTGCKKSASKVNLINNGRRNDIYQDTADDMRRLHNVKLTRAELKEPIMTLFYNSTAQPAALLGKGTPELAAFYEIMRTEVTGAYNLLGDIQSLQDESATLYSWHLPDRHTSYVPVMDTVDKKVEIAELNKATYTYRTMINMAKEFDLSLPANVVHSIDGYLVRQMYRRAKKMGYALTTIHDSFWASPMYMQDVRETYAEELAKLAESNIIENILNEISGSTGTFTKYSDDLPDLIRQSEYALS